MNERIALTKTALVALIVAAQSLDPNDPDLLDELGSPPWLSWRVRRRWWLRPVPAGPQPEPWRSRLTTRAVIEELAGQAALATTLAGVEGEERAAGYARSQLQAFTDDFCGTPPRWPGPRPGPNPGPGPGDPFLRLDTPRSIDLLVAGAELERAAELKANGPLQPVFAEAADRLFAAGLQQLESSVRGG